MKTRIFVKTNEPYNNVISQKSLGPATFEILQTEIAKCGKETSYNFNLGGHLNQLKSALTIYTYHTLSLRGGGFFLKTNK